jgi:hypothetical protein
MSTSQINIIPANVNDDLQSIFELINKAYNVEMGNYIIICFNLFYHNIMLYAFLSKLFILYYIILYYI